MRKPTVLLLVPFTADLVTSVAYANACMQDALSRGEAPLCLDLLYVNGILELEGLEGEVTRLALQDAWIETVTVVVQYIDLSATAAMDYAARRTAALNRNMEIRKLPEEALARLTEQLGCGLQLPLV